MVQSLPGFLNLSLNVCSPCQVLGDVYTEVLEATHPLHRGPADHKRSVGLLLSLPEVHDQLFGFAHVQRETVVLAPWCGSCSWAVPNCPGLSLSNTSAWGNSEKSSQFEGVSASSSGGTFTTPLSGVTVSLPDCSSEGASNNRKDWGFLALSIYPDFRPWRDFSGI